MTAKHSILVMIARYQGAHSGGGVSVHSHVLEYEDATAAHAALVALTRARELRDQGNAGTGRFIVDAVPLWG